MADLGLTPMRDVPGYTTYRLTSRLSEALKLAAGIGVLAVVDEAALLNKQTAPVLRSHAPGALGRTDDIPRHLKESFLARPVNGSVGVTGAGIFFCFLFFG